MFGQVVIVTGDGTNNDPALREEDIGLALGIVGRGVVKENAYVIVLDDNFTTIIIVAKWSRVVYINIQKFVQFQLTINMVALMVNFFQRASQEVLLLLLFGYFGLIRLWTRSVLWP